MTQLTNSDVIALAALGLGQIVSLGAWIGNLMRRVQKLEGEMTSMHQWRGDMKAETTAMQLFRETMIQNVAEIKATVNNTNSELDRIQRHLEHHK